MINKRHFWLISGVLALLVIMTMPLWANTLGSTFLLRKHTFANAGGQLQSSNYVLYSAFGQPSVVGDLNSANLRLQAGYLAGAVVALTPTPTNTPGPSPTPTATNTPGPSPTPTATNTPGPSPTPTATNTPGPSPTPTATNTPGPSPTPTATNTPGPSPTPTPEPSDYMIYLPIIIR